MPHGEEVVKNNVSNYFLTDEINSNYNGMMVALPPEEWTCFQTMTTTAMAAQLKRWARGMDLENYPKHRRGPKKPVSKRPNAKFQHVSTWKLLEERRQKKRSERKLAGTTTLNAPSKPWLESLTYGNAGTALGSASSSHVSGRCFFSAHKLRGKPTSLY